jgi:hypothetical protein
MQFIVSSCKAAELNAKEEYTVAPFDLGHHLKEEIDRLNPEQQQRLLEIARGLKSSTLPPGTTWEEIREFTGTISHEDAEDMRRAIEEGCENIDYNSW